MELYQMSDDTHLIGEVAPGAGLDPLKIKLGVSGVVRYWGTTKGRGELCIDGPTSSTRFDVEPAGGTLSWLHVRRVIPVTEGAAAKWMALMRPEAAPVESGVSLFQMSDDTHLIGEVSPENGDPLKIKLGVSGVVRYWGTTKGRGELCIDGPTSSTRFDVEPAGGTLSWLHVRRVIPVTEGAAAKWMALMRPEAKKRKAK